MSDLPHRLTPHQASELAGDLLRELSDHIGDDDAIRAVMKRWHYVLGAKRFGVVCMASVRITFGDCLTETPIADVPPGALAFNAKETAA